MQIVTAFPACHFAHCSFLYSPGLQFRHDFFAFRQSTSALNHETTIIRERASAASMDYDDQIAPVNPYENPAAQTNPYMNGYPGGQQPGSYGAQIPYNQGLALHQAVAAPRPARGVKQVVKLASNTFP